MATRSVAPTARRECTLAQTVTLAPAKEEQFCGCNANNSVVEKAGVAGSSCVPLETCGRKGKSLLRPLSECQSARRATKSTGWARSSR